MGARKTEWRLSKHGMPMRRLAEAEGSSMVRHKGCYVHVINTNEWDNLPLCDTNGRPLSQPPEHP